MADKISLRDVLGGYLVELGKIDSKVVLVNADLMGTCRNRSFAEAFPNRSFNVGIAEQNMVSFAAGLAHEGFRPYAFTMAPFMSMRACEQVRTDVAYANVDVKLIATYAGMSGGISGATHWGIEDCAIMCSFPNMVVVEPSDPTGAKKLMLAIHQHEGPVYLRSTVEKVPVLYGEDREFEIGKACALRQGNDCAIICSGVCVSHAAAASDQLKEHYGLSVSVIDMHTVKPIDREAIRQAANTKAVLVVQDHNIIGGLGSMVAGVLAEEGLTTKFKILGLQDEFVAMAHAPFLYKKYHMDSEGIKEEVLNLMGHRQ